MARLTLTLLPSKGPFSLDCLFKTKTSFGEHYPCVVGDTTVTARVPLAVREGQRARLVWGALAGGSRGVQSSQHSRVHEQKSLPVPMWKVPCALVPAPSFISAETCIT